MRKKNVAIVLISVLLASCAKEGPNGPTGPAGPVYYGDISGHVTLYDMYGSQVFANRNKVSLYLDNTSIANYPDTTGYYIYANEPTAEYSITATDDSFASTVINNIDFVSGTLNVDIRLSKIPDTTFIINIRATVSALADSLYITVSPDPNARLRNCIVFVNSYDPASNTAFLLSYVVPVPGNATTVALAFPALDLINTGLAPGASVYYAAYSYVVNDASVYENPTTGAKVYNAVYPVADTVSSFVP
jgi:hypothetical protein